MSILCSRCRRKHPIRECPLDIKETNKCAICADNHAMDKCPSIPELKLVLGGVQSKSESLHAMRERRNWTQVSAGMALVPPPYFFGYNAHPYSYPNTCHSQHWQHGNHFHHGYSSQSWQQGWRMSFNRL